MQCLSKKAEWEILYGQQEKFFVLNHPFFDGNKHTELASSLTFLFLNGYEIDKAYEENLEDMTLIPDRIDLPVVMLNKQKQRIGNV